MHYWTSNHSPGKPPQREGWIYEKDPTGSGYYGYIADARPDINWNHIDGPLLHFRNGEMHWLTLRERFRCWIGLDDALSLEARHRPRLVR
jgi:hypothetical protein